MKLKPVNRTKNGNKKRNNRMYGDPPHAGRVATPGGMIQFHETQGQGVGQTTPGSQWGGYGGSGWGGGMDTDPGQLSWDNNYGPPVDQFSIITADCSCYSGFGAVIAAILENGEGCYSAMTYEYIGKYCE